MSHEKDINNSSTTKTKKTITVVGFGPRLAASLLDAVFIGFLSMMLGLFIGIAGVLVDMYTPNRPIPLEQLIIVSGLVFSVAYYVAAWAKSGQTIGKMTLGLKVVGADGKPPSGGKAVLRYIGYFVSGIVLSLGFLWVVFDRKRQGWHDKLAGTFVVHNDTHFSEADAVDMLPSDSKLGWPWILLWIFFAVSVPFGLVAAVLTLGPYVGTIITSFFTSVR